MEFVNQPEQADREPRNAVQTLSLTGRTRVVGVWGHPVSHSRSPMMHNAALGVLGLDWVYVPFDVDPDRVSVAVDAIRALDLVGVNVTVPLKERVIEHLDHVDEAAARIGSVNTIRNVAGDLYGYSTDGAGFMRALAACGWPVEGQSVYMIGAGGSAKAVAFALAERGNRLFVANRTLGRADELVRIVNDSFGGAASVAPWPEVDGEGDVAEPIDLVVNTTSIGMHPREAECPSLPKGLLSAGKRVYDLIYAPTETRLLLKAKEAGCLTSNGLGMLVEQGALSLSIWTEIDVDHLPVDIMRAAAQEA